MRTPIPLMVLVAVGITASVPLHTSGVSARTVREEFTAFAVNMNSGPTTATVTIRIERWSTQEEREQLVSALKEASSVTRANRQLLRALQRMPRAGFIRTPDSLAWNLRYTQQQPLEEGGRQIVLATDRPIGFWEARNQPRRSDYPFTVLELHLDKDNRGEGRMLAGTRIFIDPRTSNLVLEHYERQPVRLNRIRPR